MNKFRAFINSKFVRTLDGGIKYRDAAVTRREAELLMLGERIEEVNRSLALLRMALCADILHMLLITKEVSNVEIECQKRIIDYYEGREKWKEHNGG